MNDLLKSDQFAEWIIIAFVSGLTWIFGYLDRRKPYLLNIPRWLTITAARKQGTPIGVYGITIQLFALLLLVWETLLVIVIPSHQIRIFLLGIGILIIGALDILFRIVIERSNNNSKVSSAKKWIEAAKILAHDPSAIVPCPELNDGFLLVHDEVFRDDLTLMERYLVCNKCGARNIIRMRVPNANKK